MDIDLVKVFQACKKPCFGCRKRRAKLLQMYHKTKTWILIWPLFLFSPWRWRWLYLFCSSIENMKWEGIRHAVIWSHWCRVAYPGRTAKSAVIEYLEMFNSLKNADTRNALKRALDSLQEDSDENI